MRLLSWNIQWGRGMDGRVDLDRIADTIHGLGNFHVICLQEVAVNFTGLEGGSGEDEVAQLAAHFPGFTPIYAPALDVPDGRGGRKLFGNLILSRMPVGQVFRHLLPWPLDADVPSMQRVLLEATIEADFGPLRVMTTHLEYYSSIIRVAQVDAIRALHAQVCAWATAPKPKPENSGGSFQAYPRPASALLCGDMNFPVETAERARLLAPYRNGTLNWRDSWDVMHPELPHPPSVGIHRVDFVDAPTCFDYVFVTQDIAPYLKTYGTDAGTEASDHQPIWIELSEDGPNIDTGM